MKLQNLKNGIQNYKLHNAVHILNTELQCSVKWTAAYAQNEHSCSSSAWWPTRKTGLVWKSRNYMLCACVRACVCVGGDYRQLISTACVCVWQWYNVQTTGLPNSAPHLHLAETRKYLIDTSQHCRHQGTHWDGQTSKLAVYDTWPCFDKRNCAAYHSG
jgi:hypothetical protein